MDHDGTAKNKNLPFHRGNKSLSANNFQTGLARLGHAKSRQTCGELHVMQSCCSALLFPDELDGSSDP